MFGADQIATHGGRLGHTGDEAHSSGLQRMALEAAERHLIQQIHHDHRMAIFARVVGADAHPHDARDLADEIPYLAERAVDALARDARLDAHDDFMSDHAVLSRLITAIGPDIP